MHSVYQLITSTTCRHVHVIMVNRCNYYYFFFNQLFILEFIQFILQSKKPKHTNVETCRSNEDIFKIISNDNDIDSPNEVHVLVGIKSPGRLWHCWSQDIG